MKIGIACDHRGYSLKTKLADALKESYEIVDFGTNSEEMVDYPDYAFLLGEAVAKKEVSYGIAICGSGIGISIACNKVKGVRASKVGTKEEAIMTRLDNDANIICMAGNQKEEEAIQLVEVFLNTKFSQEERHARRLQKIESYEEKKYVC